MNLISKKKLPVPLSQAFTKYLQRHRREINLPLLYADLARYEGSIPLFNRDGKDTLWVTVFYSQGDQQEVHRGLKKIYALLKAGGNDAIIEHLYVDRIDLCVYGNTLPFRIRIVNKLNDNFDYFYVKQADESRVLGLELEHILSPSRINYLVHKNTLIEEHIAGIPADQFLSGRMAENNLDEIRLAKEFVKFNERCFIRLLGDMHSSNFIIDITPDFEETHYRMRAIDFDQQSFEGNKKVYLPQFFKQNLKFVEMVTKHLTPESVTQYRLEERALMKARIRASKHQMKDLFDAIQHDAISPEINYLHLGNELSIHHQNEKMLNPDSMAHLLKLHLRLCLQS